MSISKAASYIGVHIETMRRWDREEKLPAVRVGKGNHRRYSKSVLDAFKAGDFADATEMNYPSSIYADRMIDFHSTAILDESYFARLTLAIAQRVEKLVDCELIDGPYDKKRDIIGYELGRYNKRKLVYIQCKHVKDISEVILQEEVDGLAKHISEASILKPTKLIFALSSNVNATTRDSVKQYVEQLLGISRSNVVFWCPAELDSKIKNERSILEEFILTGPISGAQNLKFDDPDLKQEYDSSIKRVLARTSQLIKSRQFPEAEEHLLMLLGKIPEEEKFSVERAKAYNNLGLCYKYNDKSHGDYQKAIGAFNKALDLDPGMTKAACNLVNTLLLTTNPENDKKAWEIIDKVWKESGPKDEFITLTYIQAFSIKFGKEKSLAEAARIRQELASDKSKAVFTENSGFWDFLATTYFFTNNYTKSEEFISKILAENEYDIDATYLRAMIRMRKAKKDSDRFDDFLENYQSVQEIRVVEKELRKAYQLALDGKRNDLLPEIYHNWDVCRLWLWKTSGDKLDLLEYPLPENTKIEKNHIAKIPERLLSKDYEGAYLAYKEISLGQEMPTQTKIDIAWIFKDYGYPEISLRILDDIDITQVNPRYWLFKSICQVLTENKAQALESCSHAKLAAADNETALKEVLSHTGALLMRYEKEGDRLLQNVIEYDNVFPAQKALVRLNMDDEKDLQFIKDSISERSQWFEGIKNTYLGNPLPVYSLEKVFKRTFVELWAGRGVNFPWEFHIPTNEHQLHLAELLEQSQALIYDYMSLLGLVKANLLGYAERINKKMYIHKLTFDKIQEELVQHENPTLRKLWDYLRKSSQVQIISLKEDLDSNLSKLTKIFDPWLLQTIQAAKNKGYLFVTDDLRLSKAVTHEGVKSINSFTFLLYAQNKKWIEKKDYSQILGEIADCVYSFIPFNHEDLLEIIWQDDYKLTRRSYHLIHQLLLPGSNITSFIQVFIASVRQLWQSGALPEDKIFWIQFIADEINLLFERWEKDGKERKDEDHEFINGFALMWGMAVRSGNVDDLEALKKAVSSSPTSSYLNKIKDTINKHIELRLTEIRKKT